MAAYFLSLLSIPLVYYLVYVDWQYFAFIFKIFF